MDSKTAWANFIGARKPDQALIEAFFQGYRDGMTEGLRAGRELAFKLAGSPKSDAPVEKNSN